MAKKLEKASPARAELPPRQARADAQRNLDALLRAAKAVFAAQGVDAPIRDIAKRAKVGVGTLYRHFPRREDLIAAVFQAEVDACVDAAATLAALHAPTPAIAKWAEQFTELVVTKRGLAKALHSGDPAEGRKHAQREQRLRSAFRQLLEAAAASGKIRRDVDSDELLKAILSVCRGADETQLDYAQRMVALLVDSLQVKPRR